MSTGSTESTYRSCNVDMAARSVPPRESRRMSDPEYGLHDEVLLYGVLYNHDSRRGSI